MSTIKDPGTDLVLLVNNRFTSVSLSLALSPLIFSYGERIRRRTQAQAFSHTKQAKSALSLQALHACLAFEARKCSACAKWIPADMLTCRCALQVDALKHVKMTKLTTRLLILL